MDGDRLDITWLGDSKLMVVRDGSVVMQTEPLIHSFNYPYQLGFGSYDTPGDGLQLRVSVEPGDVVVMASDGLWDNVYEDEIMSILEKPQDYQLLEYEDNGGDPRMNSYRSAVNLAHRAFQLSIDPNWLSPFAREYQQLRNSTLDGGKPDDITVVVGQVTQDRGTQGTETWCHTHFSNICERRGGGQTWERN